MRRRSWSTVFVSVAALILVTLILGTGSASAVTYKTLHAFTGPDGEDPYFDNALVFDQAGNLYGTTLGGGTYNWGTVYRLSPRPDGTWVQTVLCNFTGDLDGGEPSAEVVFDVAGNLYGTTGSGIMGGSGVVFELSPNPDGTWTESVLHRFLPGGEALPHAAPVLDAAGNLYGTTTDVSSVYKLAHNADGTWTYSVLHVFDQTGDGDSPWGGLIFDRDGNLYGTTGGGGAYNSGTVFKMTPNSDGTWTERIIYQFRPKDGSPIVHLVFDQASNLYGTTPGWGTPSDAGTVFELIANSNGSWTKHVLHFFTGGMDGGEPVAGLIIDQKGTLYGTAEVGGAHSYGVVFKLMRTTAGGWAEKVLWSFGNHPSAYPYGGLTFDGRGNLFGTTFGTERRTLGSVFEITP